MNLADMLSYADIHQLNRIARHYDCDCNTNSKRELIQSILNAVGRRDVFERYIERLSTEDVRFLNSLIFDPRDAYSLEELLALAQISRFEEAGAGSAASAHLNETKPAGGSTKTLGRKQGAGTETEPPRPSPREMIVKFAHQGWLFNGYARNTKFLYQVPSDLKRRFGDALTRMYRRRLKYVGEPPAYRDEQRMLAEDILVFLKFVRDRPVELTAEGTMYKRHIMQLLDEMNVKEEPVTKGGWRFGYGRKINDYPNRFSLIYDYCYFNRLIDEQPGQLVLTEDGAALIAGGKLPDVQALYRFWLRLYKNPIHNIQAIVNWINRLADEWVTLESLSRVLVPLIKPFYYDSPEAILSRRIVLMMMHLGLLRIGESEEDGAAVRMTKLGAAVVAGNHVPEEERIVLPPEAMP